MRSRASGEIMISNSFDGITRPSLPTLSDIQRRIAELESVQQQIDAQAQLPIRSAPRTTPPPRVPTNPILSEDALYGVAGLAVRALAPHTEAHPVTRQSASPPFHSSLCRFQQRPRPSPYHVPRAEAPQEWDSTNQRIRGSAPSAICTSIAR